MKNTVHSHFTGHSNTVAHYTSYSISSSYIDEKCAPCARLSRITTIPTSALSAPITISLASAARSQFHSPTSSVAVLASENLANSGWNPGGIRLDSESGPDPAELRSKSGPISAANAAPLAATISPNSNWNPTGIPPTPTL